MKICHITSVHIPFDTRIFHKECRSLAEAGYEVHLVVMHKKDEIVDGIIIHAVPVRKSKIMRMLFTTWDVYKKAMNLKTDLYHFHDPEMIPFGLLLKLHGKKVICDVHEDYPDYIKYKDNIPFIIRNPVAWVTGLVERLSSGFFDSIITVTPRIYNRFKPLNDKTCMICNFPFLDELSPDNCGVKWESRTDSVAYIGSLTLDRGLKEMLQATGIAHKKIPVKLILGGSFPNERVKHHIETMPEFEHVEYPGFISRKKIGEVLLRVKAGIVFTHSNSNHKFAYMTKLFEYMSAGIPVIASDFPLWREIVESAGCGVLVEPMNIEALAEAIIYVLEHPAEAEEMGRRGRKAIEEKYNWNNENVKLQSLYSNLLSRKNPA